MQAAATREMSVIASVTRRGRGSLRQARNPAPRQNGPPTSSVSRAIPTWKLWAVPRARRPAPALAAEADRRTRLANQRSLIGGLTSQTLDLGLSAWDPCARR